MIRFVGVLFACAFVFGAVGCSAEVDDDVASGEEDLSAAAQALVGAYAYAAGPIHGLVLTGEKVGQQNRFIAYMDTGIRCITAPCPSEERVEGTFSAGTKTITLRSTTASSRVANLLGKYHYAKSGDALTLTKKNVAASLAATDTYCQQASDCDAQSYIHPMCWGRKACSPDHTCGYQCGNAAPQ
jgi:hypothetical protein